MKIQYYHQELEIDDETYQLCCQSCLNNPVYSLKDVITIGKVIDVYDGDTCTINLIIEQQVKTLKCRFRGYNSPEFRVAKDHPNRKELKMKAKKSREYLCQLLEYPDNPYVVVKCFEFDKYGRLLVDVYNKHIFINEEMIKYENTQYQ